MTIMEIDLINKCRACLSDSESMHSLFDDFDQGISLFDILTSTTSFEIDKEDGLSPYLCQNCTTIIVDFHNFKTVFKENESQMKSLLKENDCKDLESEEEEKDTTNETIVDIEPISKNEDNFITIKIESSITSDEEETVSFEEENELGFTQEEADNFEAEKDTVEPEYQEINTYSCPECDNYFLHKSEFEQHISDKHENLQVNSDDCFVVSLVKVNPTPCVSKCRICNKTFQTIESYKQHFEIHKKNVCDVCGLGFVKKSYLKDHQEIHYPDKRHVCNFCNKAFKRRTVLVKHKRIHTHPRECICEICGKGFNDKGTLKTHIMLLHSKERNHVCVICGLRFPLKATLEKHIRRHQNKEREFFCTQCPLAYKDKSSLDRHIFVKHSGQNIKHTCNDCGKLYTTVSSLLKHQRVCHHRQIIADQN